MTGEDVRKKLIESGVVLSNLASQLGITAQSLNSRFKVRYFRPEYIDEISKITGIEFEEPKSDASLIEVISSLSHTIESQQRIIESQQRTIESLTIGNNIPKSEK